MVELILASIRIHAADNLPVMLLKENTAMGRTLPILIGHEEANAILRVQQGHSSPRPLTHDLFRDVLEALNATVESILITDLVGRTFYADLNLRIGDRRITVSARPSDAVALAVRTGATIYGEEGLLEREGVMLAEDFEDDESEEAEEQVIEEFQKFVENVRPEDFASGQ